MTGSGMRPLDRPCSEQGKRPTAKAFKLAERDKHMSEEKQSSYLQELDQWSDANVVGPLYFAAQNQQDGAPEEWEQTVQQVLKAIRDKVRESYHNGQAAGPRQPVQVRRRGQPAMSWVKR